MGAVLTRPVLRLCAWCLAAVVIEVALYLSYQGHDASFHWFTHFLIGAAVALLGMTVMVLRAGRPVPMPLVWPVLAHVYAMVPDLLFTGGAAHERWMDVFLGHLSSHFVPGANLTWFAAFLTALTLHLVVLDRQRPT